MFSRFFSLHAKAIVCGLVVVGALCATGELPATSKNIIPKKSSSICRASSSIWAWFLNSQYYANVPVFFDKVELVKNVRIKHKNSVYKIEEGALCIIQSYGTISNGIVGEKYVANTRINVKTYKSFESTYTPTSSTGSFALGSYVVLYLKKGDEVSFVLTKAPAGISKQERHLVLLNANNIIGFGG